MIKKDSKQLRKLKNCEPEAINILRRISEYTYTSGSINSFKFPHNTIHHTTQEEEIADWGKEENQTLHNQETKVTKINFKTAFKDLKQTRKNQRYRVHLRTLANDSSTENVQANQMGVNTQKNQFEKQRPRCALKNISPDFQNDKKHQLVDYFSGTKLTSHQNKYHPYASIQRKGLAIKKIKKELLHNLEARSKLPFSPKNLESSNTHKKNKLCSEIHFKLNLQPQISRKKVSSTPKNIRLASWQNYIKARSSTVQRCFDQYRDNSLIRLKTDDSAQYKMLKKLLYRQRN